MTDSPHNHFEADPALFHRAINFFMQDRHSAYGSPIPNDIAAAPVVLGFIPSETGSTDMASTCAVTQLLDWFSDTSVFDKPANTPYKAGSRPDYRVVMAYATPEEGKLFQPIFGTTHFRTIRLDNLINEAVRNDLGICLFGDHRMAITEPDRLIEYVHLVPPGYRLSGDAKQLGDITAHTLEPREYQRLEELMTQPQQDWVAQWEVGGTTFRGMFTNLLAVTPKPGLSPDQLKARVDTLTYGISKIKMPFAVLPVIARPPITRGLN